MVVSGRDGARRWFDVVPAFLRLSEHSSSHIRFAINSAWLAILATSVQAALYLIVTGAIAALVFEKFGVNFLRKAWISVDLIWAAALVLTGVANLLL